MSTELEIPDCILTPRRAAKTRVIDPILIDRAAFAALLSIAESTFDRCRAAGLIGPQPLRIGGALRWHRDDVERWLAARASVGTLYDADAWPAQSAKGAGHE